MIGNEMTQRIIKQLANEKISHLFSLLKHRYGIEVNFDSCNDEYSIVLNDDKLENPITLRFQTKQLLSLNTMAVAELFNIVLVSRIIFKERQSYSFDLQELKTLLPTFNLQVKSMEFQKFFYTDIENLEYDWLILLFRLVGEIVDHITTLLNFKYGIESAMYVGYKSLSFSILLYDIEVTHDFSFTEIILCNVEKEALKIRKAFMQKIAS